MNNQISFMDETEDEFVERMLPVCVLYCEYENGRSFSTHNLEYLYSTEYGFEFKVEYNDSCSCHPEYIEYEFDVPWEWIMKYNENPNQTINELNTSIKEKRDRQKKEAEKKAAAEQRKREKQIEEGERGLLAKLKLKYEGSTS